MKILVAVGKCAGHGRCTAIAPEIFVPDDNGYLNRAEIEVPKGKEALALRGVRACPERCLSAIQGATE